MTRRRRGGIKRGENNLASNQFPMCFPQSETLREGSQSYIEKIRERKDLEMSRRRKRGIKRKEIDLGNTLFVKCSPQPRTPREIHRVKKKIEGGGRR